MTKKNLKLKVDRNDGPLWSAAKLRLQATPENLQDAGFETLRELTHEWASGTTNDIEFHTLPTLQLLRNMGVSSAVVLPKCITSTSGWGWDNEAPTWTRSLFAQNTTGPATSEPQFTQVANPSRRTSGQKSLYSRGIATTHLAAKSVPF